MKRQLLHVVRSLRPETGGLAEYVRNLAQAQRRRGDAVTVVSLDPADVSEAGVVVLGQHSNGYGYSPNLVPWLRNHGEEFDLVAAHGLWQYQGFGVWRALRGSATPYVVFCHGMLDPWFKRAYPLKHFKKWLYWPWAEYRVLRDAAAVCFSADDERRSARDSFAFYRARERVMAFGIPEPGGEVEDQRTAFFAAYPDLRGKSFLLFLGRVHAKKGVDLLLSAYASVFKDAVEAPALMIAGPCHDEAYRRQLVDEADRLGIGTRLVWVPMLSGDLKWGALRACEAFVLFSHQENFGVAVVEALACGKPVLISDRINIHREVVEDGAALVASDSAEGSMATLTRWRELSGVDRAKMAEMARASFTRRYAMDRTVDAFASMADELTGVRSEPPEKAEP